MSRIVAMILLLLHMNVSMFVPVMDETDFFDARGVQVDDINSAYEYVDQIMLGNKDETPEDEDDDQAHYFNVVHLVKECVVPRIDLPQHKYASLVAWIEKPGFLPLPESRWTSVVHEIAGPPPKA